MGGASSDVCLGCARPRAEHSADDDWLVCPDGVMLVPPEYFRPAPVVIEGIGADAPITTNDAGGRQSASPFRCDLLPPHAVLRVAEVLAHGAAKYGPNNWHKIGVADHLNHALAHLFAHLAGDTQDDHLGHAGCRIMMAIDQHLSGRGVQ